MSRVPFRIFLRTVFRTTLSNSAQRIFGFTPSSSVFHSKLKLLLKGSALYVAFRYGLQQHSRSVLTSINDSDSGQKVSRRLKRFRDFSSIEYQGIEYMTPQDFLDCLILDKPRERVFRRVINNKQLKKMINATPPLRKGNDKLFQTLGENGIISYSEYIFLITLLTKSQFAFQIAFLMFDEDENLQIDKSEFLLFGNMVSSSVHHSRRADDELNAESRDNLLGIKTKDTCDTTILTHLFGKRGQNLLSLQQFEFFFYNLQRELIEIEFYEFARGKTEISSVDFARLVLRYSKLQKEEYAKYVKTIYERTELDDEGITLQQFEQFFMFLSNLEDFTKAVRLYCAAEIPVSQSEFIRAVKCSTGFQLDPHLVDVLFKIFDTNDDGKLSYSEFIAIMNDRLHRGFKVVYFAC